MQSKGGEGDDGGGGLPARMEEFLVLLMKHSSHRFLQKAVSSNMYTQGQFPQST